MKVAMIFQAIDNASRVIRTISGGVSRMNQLSARGFANVAQGAGRLKSSLITTGAALTAYVGSAVLAARAFLAPARQFENFGAVLETTEGSAAKAKAALGWVENFAIKTPYELDQVMESFVQLRAYGLDPTNGLLKTLGDTASARNKPITQAVEAIADAVTGENERLKEFGVKARAEGQYFLYEYTENGVTKVAKALKNDRAAIQKTLEDIFNSKFEGAMERRAKTLDGILSNIFDWWSKFQRMVMSAGLFDHIKDKAKLLLDTLDAWGESGKMQEFARIISDNIIDALKIGWEIAKGLVTAFRALGGWLSWGAEKLGSWNRLAAVLVAIPLAPMLLNAALGVMQIARGLALIAISPAGLVIAGLAAAAWLLVDDWGAVFQWLETKAKAVADAFMKLKTLVQDIIADPTEIMSKLGSFDWANVIPDLSWAAFIPALIWPSFVVKLVWGTLVTALKWGAFIGKLPWSGFVRALSWASLIPKLRWPAFITRLSWRSLIPTLAWARMLPKLNWASFAGKLSWRALITPLRWGLRFIPAIGWAALAGELVWSLLIKPLGWDKYISVDGLRSAWNRVSEWFTSIDWGGLIPEISWDDVLPAISWAKWITPIPWLELIPGFSWSDIVNRVGQFDWSSLVPEFKWPEWPEITLPTMPDLAQVEKALTIFFSGAWLPKWSWPAIPLPELPDLSALDEWLGPIADKITSIFSGVSKTVSDGINSIASLFTDRTPLEIAATDPASIERATAAAKGLETALQGAAAVDVTGPMRQLAAIENTANRIPGVVTSMVGQVRSILAGADFTSQGMRMMDTLAAGIRARAVAVTNEIRKVTQAVRDHLPSSPAKVGPLSDIHRLKFMETIAGTIRPEPLVAAMRAASIAGLAALQFSGASPADASAPGAGRTAASRAAAARPASAPPIHIDGSMHIEIHGDGAADLEGKLEKLLREHRHKMTNVVLEELARRDRRRH